MLIPSLVVIDRSPRDYGVSVICIFVHCIILCIFCPIGFMENMQNFPDNMTRKTCEGESAK